MVGDEQTTQRIRGELRQIVPIVEEMTGLKSRWNGSVELVHEAAFIGRKSSHCDVLLDAEIALKEIRWRTLLHEILHSVSAGYNQIDYNRFYGWEEGVVEGTQRLSRRIILSRLGVAVEDKVFEAVEIDHPFNRYIEALQKIRMEIGTDDESRFFLELLRTPIKDRYMLLHSIGIREGGEKGRHIIGIVSAARSVLERKLP